MSGVSDAKNPHSARTYVVYTCLYGVISNEGDMNMPWRGTTVRRRASVVGLVLFGVLGSIFVISYASNARTESGSKYFKAGVGFKKTKLLCSGVSDRVYLSTVATYGQPKERLSDIHRVAQVKLKVRVLKRKGKKRVIAASVQKADIELNAKGSKTSHGHTVRFGPKNSKRILRYVYGKSNCEQRKSKRVIVKLYVTEKLVSPSSSSSTSSAEYLQRKQQSLVKKIRYRSCVSYEASDCLEPPTQGGEQKAEPGEQEAGHGETRSDDAETSRDQEDSSSCVPADQLDTQSPSADYSQRNQLGTVESSAITETSGLASSRKNSGVLWLHNDSGDSARLYAINTEGQLLGTYTISGASASDWEDMAIGPGPESGVDYLYIADIGDNSAVRSSVKLYRLQEPTVSSSRSGQDSSLSVSDSIQITYPDGSRDAETLMVDPQDGDVYVVSKREFFSRIYRLPSEQWANSSATLDFVDALSWGGAVGGDISPSGDQVLIKGYWSVLLYERSEGTDISDALSGSPTSLSYTAERQGEAIAFCGQGSGYFTLSEGSDQPLYYYW